MIKPDHIALAVCVILLGCAGSPSPSEGVAPVVAMQGSWKLVDGTHRGRPIPVVPGRDITLTARGQEVSGTAACNGYGATIAAAPDRIALSDIAATQMACEGEGVMESEAAYLGALQDVTNAARQDDRLILVGIGVELRYELVPPVPSAALVGTEWLLESLIQGELASSTAAESTLVLRSDGTLTGSTGCRQLSGRYVITGGEVRVTELKAEGECPPELVAQDALVVSAVGDGFAPAVAGGTMTIDSGTGLGLVYRSAGSGEPSAPPTP